MYVLMFGLWRRCILGCVCHNTHIFMFITFVPLRRCPYAFAVIFNFVARRYLDRNKLSGTIPAQLGEITALNYM
jgi:hypothetical protein